MYRNMKLRMYYSKVNPEKTPLPFAEFRVFVITDKKSIIPEEFFDEILDKLEFIFQSVRISREQNAIYYIEGVERNREIEKDEALEYFLRTGVEVELGMPFRQVTFFDKEGKIKKNYNEAMIRDVEKVTFALSAFRDWKGRMKQLRVFEDDVKGLSMEEFEEYTFF
jgi:hypothetical protein